MTLVLWIMMILITIRMKLIVKAGRKAVEGALGTKKEGKLSWNMFALSWLRA